MLIKHVNKKVFDLFYNNGWENWARFQISKTNDHHRKIEQIAGDPAIPGGIIQFLEKKYGAK
jgi:hypothetical protein